MESINNNKIQEREEARLEKRVVSDQNVREKRMQNFRSLDVEIFF